MVRIMPNQTRRGAAYAESPVLGLALAARQGQNLSRHSAASPTVHILAEGDRTAWLMTQSAENQSPKTKFLAKREFSREFRRIRPSPRFSCPMSARILWLPAEFTTQRNREFSTCIRESFSRNREF